MLHTHILHMFRDEIENYLTSPLPDWGVFAESTSMMAIGARHALRSNGGEAFVLAEGLVKLVDDIGPLAKGQIIDFYEAVSILTPNVKPLWANRMAAPYSASRWQDREWSVRPKTFVAIEPCILMRIDFRVFERLAARHVAWGQVYISVLWSHIDALAATADDTAVKDVEARYRRLIARASSFADRVSQRDMASFLNVTEPALSRIAKRVRIAELEDATRSESASTDF